jgi:membrane protein
MAEALKSAKNPWSFGTVKHAAVDFLADDALTLAAAVAYYTALSFAPLLVLVTLLVGFFLGPDMTQRVVAEITTLMGSGIGGVIEQIMQAQDEQQAGGDQVQQVTQGGFSAVTGAIGIIALIWSASGVFAQLQAALNRIWDVEAAAGQGIVGWLRKRLLSVGIVFSILFLLLASLAVTALLNVFLSGDTVVWQFVNFGVSIAIYIVLFGLIFKYLPDVEIPWKAVLFGAVLTAVLFAIGKWAIGQYLSRGSVGGSYGGAGSLVVLLVWVYYSAIIVFFGAEVTQAWARRAGLRIQADEHAKPVDPKLAKGPIEPPGTHTPAGEQSTAERAYG